ncbi:MAG: HAMP domain-containing histidine kinase [Oscillospiraceae bacterium]|nr:HAMP domain-containing histidine kinase [Oscillospiraceae bacterium]
MLKSVYSRIFYFCTVILIFFCALTGLVITLCATYRYKSEAEKEFRDTAQVLLVRVRDAYMQANELPHEQLQQELQDYTRTYNIDCYLFHGISDCVVRSDYNYVDIPLPKAARAIAVDEEYCEIGSDFGNFEGASACFVKRFQLEDDNGYYLMLMIPTENINEFSFHLIFALIVTVLLIALIVAPLFYLNTASLLKPIINITHTAEAYANGDFSERLETGGGDSELDYLAETMNRMADFIDRNEQSRKNFVSNVSHELKTPMTTIGGFVDGILDGTIPPEQEKQYLRTVSSEVQRMSRLVHSMLNISKFEEGSLEPNFVQMDITHLLIKTLLLFEKKVDAKHLSVEGLEDCPRTKVECDEDLMQQVFYNLTENAIKFVNDGGTLSVRVLTDDDMAHIHLRNTGEGLTDDEITHVFERFYKTDASRGKDTTGVGLGLSIVSRIVRLHDGTVTVKSVPKEYTEFVVSIPLTHKSSAEQGDAPRKSKKKE